MSTLLPQLARHVDDMTFLHSMTSKSNTHGPGNIFMKTCFVREGCPSADLLDEIVRRPAVTKKAFTGELTELMDEIAARLDPTDLEATRTNALILFALMVGTLQLARALTDRALSDRLLARGAEQALDLLDNFAH